MSFVARRDTTDRGKTTNLTRSMRIVFWMGIAWAAILLLMAAGTEVLLHKAAAQAETLKSSNAGGRSLCARLLNLSARVSTAEAEYAEIEKRLRLKDAKARAWDRMMTLVGMGDSHVRHGNDKKSRAKDRKGQR